MLAKISTLAKKIMKGSGVHQEGCLEVFAGQFTIFYASVGSVSRC